MTELIHVDFKTKQVTDRQQLELPLDPDPKPFTASEYGKALAAVLSELAAEGCDITNAMLIVPRDAQEAPVVVSMNQHQTSEEALVLLQAAIDKEAYQ